MISFYDGSAPFFDAFYRISQCKDGTSNVTQIFPKKKQEINKNVIRFCFPIECGAPPGKFTFAVKEGDDKLTYGYVIQNVENGELVAYCVVSSFFDQLRILQLISFYMEKVKAGDSSRALSVLESQIHQNQNCDSFLAEQILVNSTALELIRTIGPEAVGEMIACIALDERIVVASYSLELLSKMSFAIISLFYPLKWPGVFIPVLPCFLADTLLAPFPFIIGIHASLMPKIVWDDLESHVLVDADNRSIDYRRTIELPNSIKSCIRAFSKEVLTANPIDVVSYCRKLFLFIVSQGIGTKGDPEKLVSVWNKKRSKDMSKLNDFSRAILESQTVLSLMRVAESELKKEHPDDETFISYWPNYKGANVSISTKREIKYLSVDSSDHLAPVASVPKKCDTFSQAPRKATLQSPVVVPKYGTTTQRPSSKTPPKLTKSPDEMTFSERIAFYQSLIN